MQQIKKVWPKDGTLPQRYLKNLVGFLIDIVVVVAVVVVVAAAAAAWNFLAAVVDDVDFVGNLTTIRPAKHHLIKSTCKTTTAY